VGVEVEGESRWWPLGDPAGLAGEDQARAAAKEALRGARAFVLVAAAEYGADVIGGGEPDPAFVAAASAGFLRWFDDVVAMGAEAEAAEADGEGER
jgi:hypothetical protein